ncbi:thioesterase family protein [Pectinatus cerevisiiphilus]|uniref:Putative thioesterase n=1 Tax=Pectinatus cerevisiiphilus TaxID=86956 RepID=A0A4R3KBB2_9FIRM|nr:thioesterase family protein [Pectinatus cerevisiiphilus]TCS80436.1 putative thioesterase [Pectinatus cerevisiiphilus]
MEITEKVKTGLKKEISGSVTEKNTAIAMKSGTLPVYATPAMMALMEQAAAELVQEYLPEGWTSVGIAMSVAHTSASPVGMKVRAEAKITAVDGRKISYEVTAFDQSGEIGRGTHERFAVNEEKFMKKTNSKK